MTTFTKRGSSRWDELSEAVLNDGYQLSRDEASSILECPDVELLDLLSAAYTVRNRYFGNSVQLYFLMNAKSGLCPEDCSYCSQSKVAQSDIPRYNLLDAEQLMAGAAAAAERHAKTFCIVISARGPSGQEMEAVTAIVPKIKQQYNLDICVSLGLLNGEQAQALKDCGVDRVNHNLNTGRDFYANICSTHTYDDRIATLSAVREAGMQLCSGGILGMGETHQDIVAMAFELRDLQVESIPVNFLIDINGTPLENYDQLNPRYCLKALAMFRLVNPTRELRIAGGRERHLRSMQCLGLYPANSLFVGDYLTTGGQLPQEDYQMIEDMGFEVTGANRSH